MDFTAYSSLLNNYKNRKIGFIGVGVSNTPIAKLFCKAGIEVSIRDRKQLEPSLLSELSALGARIITGDSYLDGIYEDMLFLSPAIKMFPKLIESEKNGTILTGELGEFFKFCPCKKICVTGSDGKTTTTTLIAKLLEKAGRRVYLGGNIGKNLFVELPYIQKNDFVVAEVSSFQLQKLRFSPDVAVITNVSPNHLDWHTDMNEYIEAKKRIFKFQNSSNKLVLNFDNDITRAFLNEAHSKTVFFSRQNSDCDYYFDGRYIIRRGQQIIDCDVVILPGLHNRENLMAALAATEGLVDLESAQDVATRFTGVEHRCEFIRELGGVKYYNSSIDSSPTRTKAALESFKEKLIVIAGGYDKNIPADLLGNVFKRKVRAAVLMGNTAPKLEKMLSDCGYIGKIVRVSNMRDAVSTARSLAREGDSVILSPAAASFDLFKNFAERGNVFRAEVNSLK